MKKTITIEKLTFQDIHSEKTGKDYTKCNIKTTNGEWISGFKSALTDTFVEGDTVELEVEEKQYNGKTYLNFKSPSKYDMLEARIDRIEDFLKRLKDKVLSIEKQVVDNQVMTPEKEENPFNDIE